MTLQGARLRPGNFKKSDITAEIRSASKQENSGVQRRLRMRGTWVLQH